MENQSNLILPCFVLIKYSSINLEYILIPKLNREILFGMSSELPKIRSHEAFFLTALANGEFVDIDCKNDMVKTGLNLTLKIGM